MANKLIFFAEKNVAFSLQNVTTPIHYLNPGLILHTQFWVFPVRMKEWFFPHTAAHMLFTVWIFNPSHAE